MSSDELPQIFAKYAVKFVRPDQGLLAPESTAPKVRKPRAPKIKVEEAPVAEAPKVRKPRAPKIKVEEVAPVVETPKVKKVRERKKPADMSAITPLPPAVTEAEAEPPVKKPRAKKVKAPEPVATVPATASEPVVSKEKKKRAPTAYNIALGKHMKAGKTMKEASILAKAETAKSA